MCAFYRTKYIARFFPLLSLCLFGVASRPQAQHKTGPGVDSSFIKAVQAQQQASAQQIQRLNADIADLKQQLMMAKKLGFERYVNTAIFLDAALSTTNNLQTLVYKESYRNKIAGLNNPTSNELGINLEMEIQAALKPLMAKARKTSETKMGQVMSSFLQTGSRNSLFPAGNVFGSILSTVGTITTQEKSISQKDLDSFVRRIEKYFVQYERLHRSNVAFSQDMEKLKAKLRLMQDDIKTLMMDLVLTTDKTMKRGQIKNLTTEDMMLRYYDYRSLQTKIEKLPYGSKWNYPQDALKSCKEVAHDLQRLYEEYALLYRSNYNEIRTILSDSKNMGPTVDRVQLDKTQRELDALYNDSRSADEANLRLKTLLDRLEVVIAE